MHKIDDPWIEKGSKFNIRIYLDRQRYNGVGWITIGEDVVTFTLVAVDTVPVKKTAPVLTNVYNSKSGADIRWKKVKGAGGYIVYRNRSGEGTTKVTTIENVNTLKCYDTSIKDNCYGRIYSYYVKALYEEKGKTYWIRVRGYGIYTNPTTGKETKTWSQCSNTVKVKINNLLSCVLNCHYKEEHWIEFFKMIYLWKSRKTR